MGEAATVSRFMPVLRYRDLSAAVDWLCRAFRFERHDIVTAVDGTVRRARLKFGREVILLLPVRNSAPRASEPVEDVGDEIQSYYFIVDDVDEHCYNAKEAGAEVIDIMEYDDGGRGYSCRDLEGHVWNFVTYDSSLTRAIPDGDVKQPPDKPIPVRNSLLVAAARLPNKVTRLVLVTVIGTVITVAIVGLWLVTLPQSPDNRSQAARRTHTDRLPAKAAADAQPSVPASKGVDPPQAIPAPLTSTALSTIEAPKRDEGDVRPAAQPTAPASKDAAEPVPQRAPIQLRNPGTAEPAPAPSKGSEDKRKQVARAVPGVPEPQSPPAPAQEQKANSNTWDCQPTPAGTVVCKPPGKKPAAAEVKAPAAPTSKNTGASASSAPPQQPQAPSASSQVWDCQPKPPTGDVVCRPIGASP
jgi:uncharacterized glyoxalase superfamily protein PhnB